MPGADPRSREEVERFCAAALPEVYGYLLARTGDPALAEELTAESFMAVVRAFRRPDPPDLTMGWIIVVARRRLVDHWRSLERQRRRARLLDVDHDDASVAYWDEPPDKELALAALMGLAPHHRAVLTLRYLDGLAVGEVAAELGRGYHATEALLQRARRALRRAYEIEVRAHA